MLIKIIIAIVLVLVIFAVFVSTRPNDFRYVRSAVINAPPSAIFPEVNDFHRWQVWSPWAKTDPNNKLTYEGPDQGEGAVFRWDGNREAGAGVNTITESRPNELIRMKLEFIRPFKGVSEVEFTFLPQGQQTEVTWAMSGKNGFMGKMMGVFMDCEKMCGDQFVIGLNNLKSLVENKTQP